MRDCSTWSEQTGRQHSTHSSKDKLDLTTLGVISSQGPTEPAVGRLYQFNSAICTTVPSAGLKRNPRSSRGDTVNLSDRYPQLRLLSENPSVQQVLFCPILPYLCDFHSSPFIDFLRPMQWLQNNYFSNKRKPQPFSFVTYNPMLIFSILCELITTRRAKYYLVTQTH